MTVNISNHQTNHNLIILYYNYIVNSLNKMSDMNELLQVMQVTTHDNLTNLI